MYVMIKAMFVLILIKLKRKRVNMKKLTVVLILLTTFSSLCCVTSEAGPETQKDAQINNEPEKPDTKGPSIEVQERKIDLGTIGLETEEIVGNIYFFNNGDEPLRVNKVDGPCACFSGYSGDKLLQPQEGGELQVKFDKKKIPAGPVKRMVRIKTNDPVNSAVEVYFSFNIERNPIEEELRKLNKEVSNLRKELRTVRNDLKKVLNELGIGAKTKKAPDTTVYDITIGSSPVLGPKDAPITIVEFADFQCPFCIREYPKIKQILKKYPQKVRLVFKHYPIRTHKQAKPAHAAAELAKLKGGPEAFWKFHDMIMANPKKLEIADLRVYAESLDLDMAKFDEAVSDEKRIDELLGADVSEAKKCKVTGTPTILINGLKMTGRSVQEYEKRVNQIIAKTTNK
jgi:protein-disulfide isomerase